MPEEVPPDDYGIKSDQLLDVAEYVIKRCWDSVISVDQRDRMNKDELDYLVTILNTASKAHKLATDVILTGEAIQRSIDEQRGSDGEQDFNDDYGEQ